MNNDLLLELLEAIQERPNKHAPLYNDGRALDANTVKHLQALIDHGMVEGTVKTSGIDGSNYRTKINGVTAQGLEYLEKLREN